jgi:hypothetical protein
MANILDKKQDVIKFELTKAGRRELSLGTLNPAFVSFFDDDVVYNLVDQKDRQETILNSTLTLGALNLTNPKLLYPLGKSSQTRDYAPAWDLEVLSGQISTTDEMPAERGYKNILDLNNSYYNRNIVFNNLQISTEIIKTNSDFSISEGATYILDSENSLKIDNDYLLLDISELNTDDDYKNFEIEVYIEDYNAQESLFNKLNFIKKPSNIIDGIIYEEDELPSRFREADLTSTSVEYFFDVLVDSEIDSNIIAAAQSATAAMSQNKLTPIKTPETTVNKDKSEPPC